MRRFARRRRMVGTWASVHREDPLSGVANLFDASIVFAVGLMVALVQAFSLGALLDPNSELTVVRRNATTGELEIIEKKAQDVTVRKMTAEEKAGDGVRLGVAYQLPDGSVVYVPETAPSQ